MSGPIVLGLRVILVLVLYMFLGWAFWTMWLDLRRSGLRAGGSKIRPIRLEVHFKEQALLFRVFSQAEVTLGRDPGCDVTIEDQAVSAHHARMSFHHGQWWLEDLGSTNGTKLNNSKLTTATVLASGDEIKCGKARIKINLGLEESRETYSKTIDR